MNKSIMLGGALTLVAASTLAAWFVVAQGVAAPASAAVTPAALSLVDRGLSGPAGPDDEGQYKLIDPIGPGGATAAAAQSEVFAPTMIGGQYTKWRPYHDPFASGSGYPGSYSPEGLP